MKFPKVQSLYVLDILLVASHRHSFPLEKFHSSDLEPHASPGLSECERRNPKPPDTPPNSAATSQNRKPEEQLLGHKL